MSGTRLALFAILIIGGVLRLVGAWQGPLDGLESAEFIPGALSIGLDHLPARAAQHGVLPLYLIRLSSLVFGGTALGFRALSVMAGTCTIFLLFLIGRRWWGHAAGLVAAAALAGERYHSTISARAVDLPFDLFFLVLAMYGFSEFLHVPSGAAHAKRAAVWLHVTAAASALAFLCKELSALMVPVLLLSLLFLRRTSWLRRRETWSAVALFLLLISPDAYSNLTITASQRMELRDQYLRMARQLGHELKEVQYLENGLYMSYGDQLSRFRSLGFNEEPFYFYFGDVFDAIGIANTNGFDEFPYMRSWFAAILWVGVAVAVGRSRKDPLTVFLLTMFAIMFLPFGLVELGEPRGNFPSDGRMLWYWVDRTMFPAMLLTSHGVALMIRRFIPFSDGECV